MPLKVVTLAFVIGAAFIEQDVEGVRTGGVSRFNGTVQTNFRHADLNRDGAMDLVFLDTACFQKQGAFSEDAKQAFPSMDNAYLVDVWKDSAFLFEGATISRFHWQDEWVLEQEPVELTEANASFGWERSEKPRFVNYLHDFDGDGTPEVIVPAGSGLSVYKLQDGNGYSLWANPDVFPPMKAVLPPNEPLWPPSSRDYPVPARQMNCRLLLEANTIRVINRLQRGDATVAYELTAYPLATDSGMVVEEQVETALTGPLPSHLQPCRLNQDEKVDFAEGRWEWNTQGGLPAPLYETTVTTDEGRQFQTFRVRGFPPGSLFVDFNGDGNLDLITQAAELVSASLRETVARFTTDPTVSYVVALHLQDDHGHFEREASVRGKFTIVLKAPPVRGGELFRRYRGGELLSLSGDFDGDGYNDAALQDQLDRISIYFGSESGFQARPATSLAIPIGWTFAVADVDGDEHADLIASGLGAAGNERSRVFLCREDQP